MQHSCYMMSMMHLPNMRHAPEVPSPEYQYRALCMSATGAHLAHKVFDGCAMEAILAHMVLCVVLVWQGIHVGRRRHCLMEGCVKDSDLLGTLDTCSSVGQPSAFNIQVYLINSLPSFKGPQLARGQYLRAAREDSTCCNNALKVCWVMQGGQGQLLP